MNTAFLEGKLITLRYSSGDKRVKTIYSDLINCNLLSIYKDGKGFSVCLTDANGCIIRTRFYADYDEAIKIYENTRVMLGNLELNKN